MNNLSSVSSVHGRFYDLSSRYYRIIGNHASYYKDALRYLGCVDIKDLLGEKHLNGSNMFPPNIRRSKHCCLHPRDREAGAGLHTWTGWTLRRRSLQLWRAGGVEHSSSCPSDRAAGDKHMCCFVSAANASCPGVSEEHRQAVAH